MSKVNRRKEIKEKEAFQLRFQLALNEKNKTILNWLPTQSEYSSEEASGAEFLNLPILANGAGLSELENDKEDQKTIGDFVNPEKDPQKLKILETRQNNAGTKAMAALMNKMRNESRGRARTDEKRPAQSQKGQKKRGSQFLGELQGKKKALENPKKSTTAEPIDSEDEEERQQSAQRSSKKVTKVNKRPF